MKTLALFVLLACSGGAFAQAKVRVGAWLPVDAKWQSAPPDVEPNLSTTSTRILYFQAGGKMSVISCVVHRRSSHYAISVGDGQTVAIGEWRAERDRIITHTRLVYRSVQKVGEELPGPWVSEVLIPQGRKLLLKGVLYRRVPDLDKSAAELMPHVSPSNP